MILLTIFFAFVKCVCLFTFLVIIIGLLWCVSYYCIFRHVPKLKEFIREMSKNT